jgi:hypothetical protein
VTFEDVKRIAALPPPELRESKSPLHDDRPDDSKLVTHKRSDREPSALESLLERSRGGGKHCFRIAVVAFILVKSRSFISRIAELREMIALHGRLRAELKREAKRSGIWGPATGSTRIVSRGGYYRIQKRPTPIPGLKPHPWKTVLNPSELDLQRVPKYSVEEAKYHINRIHQERFATLRDVLVARPGGPFPITRGTIRDGPERGMMGEWPSVKGLGRMYISLGSSTQLVWPVARAVRITPAALLAQACFKLRTEYNHHHLPPCRLNVFANHVGQMRGATVHPLEIVTAARAITQWLMPLLRQTQANKSMLSGEPVRLTRDVTDGERVFVYSADQSKASDRISVQLAQYVITRLLVLTGAPPDLIQAASTVCGHHTAIWRDKVWRLTCGALMGLGPSWIILSVLNDFATARAGIPSSAVNGDDMTALCTDDEADRYEDTLEAINCVPNRQKSFRGRPLVKVGDVSEGVFCERWVRARREVTRVTAVAKPELRLGEASGARSIDGKRGHMIVDTLLGSTTPAGCVQTHPKIRRLARRVGGSAALGSHGPLKLGGGGRGPVTRVTVSSMAMFGAVRLSQHRITDTEADDARTLKARMKTCITVGPNFPGAIRRSELSTQYATSLAVRRLEAGIHAGGAKRLSSKDHRKSVKSRISTAKRVDPLDALKTPECRELYSARARAKAHRHVLRGNFARAARILAEDDPYVIHTNEPIPGRLSALRKISPSRVLLALAGRGAIR